MTLSKYQKDVIDRIERETGFRGTPSPNGKGNHVKVQYDCGFFYVIGSTPSDRRSLIKAVSDIKRLIREHDNTKVGTIGEQVRQKKATSKPVQKEPNLLKTQLAAVHDQNRRFLAEIESLKKNLTALSQQRDHLLEQVDQHRRPLHQKIWQWITGLFQ